jgi:hypothetical protein
MLRIPRNRSLKIAVLMGVVVVLGVVPRVIGVQLAHAHRREFLAALHLPVTRAAIASDSGLQTAVRTAALGRVPLGSDTLRVKSYAAALGLDSALGYSEELMFDSSGERNIPRFSISLPERSRWYEFGVCEWSRDLSFILDARGVVHDIAVERIGSCI